MLRVLKRSDTTASIAPSADERPALKRSPGHAAPPRPADAPPAAAEGPPPSPPIAAAAASKPALPIVRPEFRLYACPQFPASPGDNSTKPRFQCNRSERGPTTERFGEPLPRLSGPHRPFAGPFSRFSLDRIPDSVNRFRVSVDRISVSVDRISVSVDRNCFSVNRFAVAPALTLPVRSTEAFSSHRTGGPLIRVATVARNVLETPPRRIIASSGGTDRCRLQCGDVSFDDMPTRDDILRRREQIIELALGWYGASDVRLFGSHARGDATPASTSICSSASSRGGHCSTRAGC